MRVLNFLTYKVVAALFCTGVLFLSSGCQSAAIQQAEPPRPVFFPAPPDKPRLQFLTSFAELEHASGGANVSAFERFLFGETAAKSETIIKPYGVQIFEGKLYVCDVGRKTVGTFDLKDNTFSYLTKDRRLINPVNIYIEEDGTKYVADSGAGAVFVFDKQNTMKAILGRQLNIKPTDIVVRGQSCYVTDVSSNQVVIFDKTTGEEIDRIGKEGTEEGQFKLIAGLALDEQGNIYVTDKVKAQITKFNEAGIFQRTIAQWGAGLYDFVRPKGIAVDREGRIWVVDASTDAGKIFDSEGQLLMFFGLKGDEPGKMNLPADIAVNYNNVELFREYAVAGASIDFLVLVTNQYGPHKIAVYGFGSFPGRQEQPSQAQQLPSK
ncbi:MAG: 6-bladed beta-propeller [Planctomycetota bacterium]|jgi:DNA-binding beta-propeller fold protein YncE